ncbi:MULTISPECIES: acyltransferase family protein [unclassified Luteococcus]|uniref:acyltransferase family protein n=1 Tax=unclassified Luteococcus TaxID=2639923 RepID=UPI00313BDE0F
MTRSIQPARQVSAAPARRLDALDGLRTVAVFLVVLFHVAVPGLSAGFIGVDIFFVLSGYLITTGLVREIQEHGRIDLVRFWTRRLRRLMPAAMLVLLTVAVWAWFWAPTYRQPVLGADIFTTVVYLANWHFMRAGSYFNADGTQSPLLHMWSLAVEEQFYLLWPLILVVTTLLSRRWVGQRHATRVPPAERRRHFIATGTGVCATLLVASALLLALWHALADSPDRAYMGTDSKAFEPLLGAVLAMLVTRPGVEDWVRERARPIGWASLAVMVGLFGWLAGPSTWYFRGGALLFSLATAGLLLACTRDAGWLVSRALSWGPVAYLGRISYGIYLWHWPLATWLDAHARFRPGHAVLVVLATVGVAALSYHLVEQPILVGRWSPWFTARRTLASAGVAMLVISLFMAPLGGTILTPLARAVLPEPPVRHNRIMFVGDSVPQRLLPVLSRVGEARGLEVGSATAGGCSPLGVQQRIADDDREGERCPEVIERQGLGLTSFRPATVVWWSRYEIADRYQGNDLLSPPSVTFWSAQLADFDRAVARLTEQGATLVVVQTEPPGRGLLTRCSPGNCHPFLQRMVTRDDYRQHWNELVRQRAQGNPRLRVISLDDVACPQPATPGPAYGSALCGDLVSPGRLARPDGSHWDTELVGEQVSTVVLDRAREASQR